MKNLFAAFLVEVLSGNPAVSAKPYLAAVKQWMTDSEDVPGDIRAAFRALSIKMSAHPNQLLVAFGEFLKTEATVALDQMATGTRSKGGDKLLAKVDRWAERKLPEAAARELAEMIKMILGEKTVWVRSAGMVSAELRAKMRQEIDNGYLVFNIDDDLLGGIQLIADGKVLDASWAGRIAQWESIGATL